MTLLFAGMVDDDLELQKTREGDRESLPTYEYQGSSDLLIVWAHTSGLMTEIRKLRYSSAAIVYSL